MSDKGGFEFSSKAMDAIACGEMLDELIQLWMEHDVDDLILKHDLEVVPKLDSIVLDGDASTNSLIPVVTQAALQASSSNEIKYCDNVKIRPCTNHLGKNCGSEAASVGKEVHKSCDCPDRLTQTGSVNKLQPKLHRGCNEASHPLVKTWQRCCSAALRGAADWKAKPGYEERSLKSIVIQSLEEVANHLMNVHDGPGFSTGERRVCRLHPLTKDDGTLYYNSRQWNGCITFNRRMKQWLQKNVLDHLDEIVHPTRGGVCQNASERVGDVALQFRDKETDLGPSHYFCSSGLAVCHVQNVVIHVFFAGSSRRRA